MAVGDRGARRNVGFVDELGARPEHGGATAEVAGQPVGPGGAEDGVRVAYPAVKSTVVDELILQASLHPELDR